MQQTYNFFAIMPSLCGEKKRLFSANLRRICFLFSACGASWWV